MVGGVRGGAGRANLADNSTEGEKLVENTIIPWNPPPLPLHIRGDYGEFNPLPVFLWGGKF